MSGRLNVFLILLLIPSIARAGDWPCFQHDPQHTGRTSDELKRPLKLLWEREIGPSTSQAIAAAGRLYVGRWQGDVLCLDQKTGQTIWSYQTEGQILFSGCVDQDRLFIGSADGAIYCLSTDGKLLWRYKTGGPIWSSPVAAGGLVYCGSKDGKLYALKAADGALAWSYDFGSPVWSSPAFSNGKVFCGSKLGKFAALDAASGKEAWVFQTAGWMVNNSPSIAGGKVFVSCLNRGYLPETGEWHIWGQGSDNVQKILVEQQATQCVYCLDEATGRVLWDYPRPEQVAKKVPGGTDYEVGLNTQAHSCPGNTPAIGDGRIYLDVCAYPFADGSRQLLILDAASGAIAAKSTSPETGIFADPVTAANILLAGDLCLMRGLAFKPDASLADRAVLGDMPGMRPGLRFMANASCADGMIFAVGLIRHNYPGGMGYIRAYSAGK